MDDKKLNYEEIIRIIELCKAVEKEGFDPFNIDVNSSLRTLKNYLPQWKKLDELLLDIEALRGITGLIRLQAEWIKHKASTLHVDPFLVELKLKMLSEETLASILMQSIHPIVSLNQISPDKIIQALDYWNRLPLIKDRIGKLNGDTLIETEYLTVEELIKMKVLSLEEFDAGLQILWDELLQKRTEFIENKIPYWEFIGSKSYEDSVRRAYLTSFLVSEGYAGMEVDPLKELIYIIPNEQRRSPPEDMLPRSIAVTFDNESWQRTMESRVNV